MTTVIPDQIRQGDVLLVPVNPVSSNTPDEPRAADGSAVLAHGEVTGHRHRFTEAHVHVHPATAKAPRHLRVVETTALLRHEEHTHLPVPPGVYALPRQVEWTDANEPRAVED